MKKSIFAISLAACVLLQSAALTVGAAGYGAKLEPLANTSAQTFSDVPASHWAFAQISGLVTRDAIDGYPGGQFRPNNTISRAEFAKVMLIAAGQEPIVTSDVTFADVPPSHWAHPYLEGAKNYMDGYTVGGRRVFKPDDAALREDIAVAAVKLSGYDVSGADLSAAEALSDYDSISESCRPYVAAAIDRGLIAGYPDGTFRARNTITRAEAATMLYRAFPGGGPGSADPLDLVGRYSYYEGKDLPAYKFIYISVGALPYNLEFADGMKIWADKVGSTCDVYHAADDADFMNQLATLKQQGYDGVIIDPNALLYKQAADILDEQGLPWNGCMGTAIEFTETYESLGLIHPYIGFDDKTIARMSVDKLVEHARTNWPGVGFDEIGFITLDFVIAYQLSLRATSAVEQWQNVYGGTGDNTFVGDPGQMLATDDSRNAVVSIVSAHPEFDYWLVYGVIETMALGAASGLEEQGIDTDHCAAAYMGGNGAEIQWAQGQDTAVKYVLDVPTIIYAEPLFFTVYAFVNGGATPETIYPSWRNPDPYYGQRYAMLTLAPLWKDATNYNDIAAWANAYIGVYYYYAGETSRPVTADSFSLYADPPSNFISAG
jgi:ABC-type sugar transport system substrate-binding protein